MSGRTLCAALALCAAAPSLGAKIAVDRARMVNLGAKGDVWKLFDEQDLAGDPKGGKGGVPVTPYTNGYIEQAFHYPLESVVDLGVVHDLTDIWYYDINGADTLQVWCGDGTTWTSMVGQSTTAYMAWVGKAAACTGRYVKFRLKSPATGITEAVLYGTPKGAVEPIPAPTPHVKPLVGDLLGLNGFIDDDRALLAAVGNLREYHSWQWDDGNGDPTTPAYPNNKFGWSPSWVRGTGWGWNFDDFYADLKGRGLAMEPVFQGSPAWMFGKAVGDSLKPMPIGRDSTLPASYKEHADYLYQFAARFGRTSVNTATLRVDALNTAVTAQGTVAWMEGWNEPDKTWKTLTGHFKPAILAAMTSADYDGDQGRLGAGFGVKTADPTMKVALPGLTEIDVEYMKAMKWWADRHRGGSFPADALNFHHYCNDAGGQGSGATKGVSPEEDNLRGKLEAMAAWRDTWLPGKELWLSEFGWDTHPNSVYRARAVGGNDEYEMQGRWLLRGILAIAASGFDKGHIYLLRDEWDNSPGIFATSGLVHDKYDTLSPKFEKKTSWYYVNTIHKTLKNYRFAADESVGGMHVFRFSHATRADSVAYAVWNEDDSAAARTVSVSTGLVSAREVKPLKGEALGVSSAASIAGGALELASVDGRPRLVVGATGSTAVARGPHAAEIVVKDRRVDGRRLDPDAVSRERIQVDPRFGH